METFLKNRKTLVPQTTINVLGIFPFESLSTAYAFYTRFKIAVIALVFSLTIIGSFLIWLQDIPSRKCIEYAKLSLLLDI